MSHKTCSTAWAVICLTALTFSDAGPCLPPVSVKAGPFKADLGNAFIDILDVIAIFTCWSSK
jgi:hypothetical protein